MKRVLSELLEIICFLGLIAGIIMMMCETDDLHDQTIMLIKGFAVFVIFAIPLIIKSARGDFQSNSDTYEEEHRNMF